MGLAFDSRLPYKQFKALEFCQLVGFCGLAGVHIAEESLHRGVRRAGVWLQADCTKSPRIKRNPSATRPDKEVMKKAGDFFSAGCLVFALSMAVPVLFQSMRPEFQNVRWCRSPREVAWTAAFLVCCWPRHLAEEQYIVEAAVERPLSQVLPLLHTSSLDATFSLPCRSMISWMPVGTTTLRRLPGSMLSRFISLGPRKALS